MHGHSTSTNDVNATVPRTKHRVGRKAQPRIVTDQRFPVTVTKVEPIVPRKRTLSAAQAEAVARQGVLPSSTRLG